MLSDLRFAFRQLTNAPGFCVTIILTLALAISACTVVFSIVNSIVLHPLDNPEPELLVRLHQRNAARVWTLISATEFLDWKNRARSFEGIYAAHQETFNITGLGDPIRLGNVQRVTTDFGKVNGIRPILGRFFAAEEGIAGRHQVVVLSYALWQSAFGGARDVVGRTLQLDGEAYTVIGVAAEQRDFAQAWVPAIFTPSELSHRARRAMRVEARLRPGVTLAQAQAEADAFSTEIAERFPNTNQGVATVLVSPVELLRTSERARELWTLLAAVGCVLLIACANVANLLLVRATARRREMAVRIAIGSGRGRLIRMLLAESLLLAVIAGVIGVLASYWELDAIRAWGGGSSRLPFVEIDHPALVVAVGITLATALLAGLAPAWIGSRIDLNDALKQGARGATAAGGTRLRQGLVVFEIALAFVLLASAGLLIRSFVAAMRADPGFVPEGALGVSYSLPETEYRTLDAEYRFACEVIDRLQSLPGVQAVGLCTEAIQGLAQGGNRFHVDQAQIVDRLARPSATVAAVTPGYLRAAGMRLLRGRWIDDQDHASARRTVVINERIAREDFTGVDPIGRRLFLHDSLNGDVEYEVVGVVADVAVNGPTEVPRQQIYVSYASRGGSRHFIAVRVSGNLAAVAGAVKAQIRDADKNLPIMVSTFEQMLEGSLRRQRFTMRLFGIFSSLALVLAAVGIYAVLAYAVSQRTNEIGIRMALGANTGDVLRLIMTHGAKLIVAGLVVGLTAALVGGRIIEAILFQTKPGDPLILATITLLLAAIAALACWLPARRATKVDPIVALRAE